MFSVPFLFTSNRTCAPDGSRKPKIKFIVIKVFVEIDCFLSDFKIKKTPHCRLQRSFHVYLNTSIEQRFRCATTIAEYLAYIG